MRIDGRDHDEMRPVKITKNYLKSPEGSVLIEVGDTRVICTAHVEEKVPMFLKDTAQGWLTAEYSMLPGAGNTRINREVSRGKVSGRTAEIQRFIGRSLRSVVDRSCFPRMTITVDCDVIQADGGTRTASLTGAYVAVEMALQKMLREKKIKRNPCTEMIAAVSVGILKGSALLDLCYKEDFNIDVDMNVVMTASGSFVEIQGTAEGNSYTKEELDKMLELSRKGIMELIAIQEECLR
ncbi:ribonuclease PH [PVC group bacterium (ex Bugula neritina AB1)]|nr:ribonuclease PH [PVC group bacterium (ex Bugula neritina AB1)]